LHVVTLDVVTLNVVTLDVVTYKTYDDFCVALNKAQPTILEIGCGPGNIAKYILSKISTANITGIDVSENMIALAKKNIPTANFQVMDCRGIDQIENKFDGIICGFTIPYLAPEDYEKLIVDCQLLLKQEGPLYISFVKGNESKSGYITGSSGDRTFFYYYELKSILSTLENNNFVILNVKELDYLKSDNTMESHTIVLAKKAIDHNLYTVLK